ncbi:ATP-binding protein [Pseudomonas sp. OV226]|uniref:ATP-binding protein n=1 Tax=Pseudomonas sp. OV226 TaxID=2135588 RepID=UPI000D6AC080|nr:ATP-binding protein [Pseudomonas sp. OV226]PWK31780.1 phage DNA replication protein (predicted replicative helicase loader) [Pseudomonas sp. OV226]
MAQRSNFRRQPESRMFTGECPIHGEIARSEVEQFDGSMLVRPCKQCQFRGLRVAAVGSSEHSQALAHLSAERVNSALVGSGITPRFAGSMFANYRVDNSAMGQALAICQGYANDFEDHYRAGRNLLLCGNVGTGKTHLASSIVQQVVRQLGAVAVITSAAEIIRVFKGSMDRDAGYSERDVIAELADLDLLVIDEVGAQAGTAYELAMLHEVFDRRYQLVRPTVVVSNMDAKGLGQYIGERALDRLRENKALLAGFTWDSERRRA